MKANFTIIWARVRTGQKSKTNRPDAYYTTAIVYCLFIE